MSETVPTVDQIYWRAYSAAIKRFLAPGGVGPDLAVFVAPQLMRGVAAGKFIPESVTNNLVYNVADDLLPGTSPLYAPGGAAKYTQQLVSYLNWVKVNNNPSQGALFRLTEALNKLNVTQENLSRQLDKALEQFSRYPDKSVSFEIWATQYGQTFLRARQANLSASGDYDQALMEYWGPDAASLIEYKDRIKLATNILSGNAGYNMSCTMTDLNDMQALWEQSNGGTKPVAPSRDRLFYRPAFSMQTLGPAVEEWIRMFGKQPTNISVNLDLGRNTKWEDLGFSRVEASASLGYWWVFSTTVTVEGVTTTKHLKLKEDEKQVSLELVCNGIASFPVAPGAWDIPGVKTLYPTLREGAPDGLLKSLIRPEACLIGYGVGAKIRFEGDVKREVHDLFYEASRERGSANIFGWCVNMGASASREASRQVTFDDVRWDKESGTMDIPPSDNGYPTLLGVLGRRL